MNINFSKEELAFQSEVREFLKDYKDLDGFYGQGHKWKEVRAMFSAMAKKNWLALSWPKEVGGLGKGPVFEFILWNEVAYARAARNPLAAGIVAHTIIREGSDAQKKQWLPRIRSGEIHFSLCYSEPEAGSDLAGLRLKAQINDATVHNEGKHYVLNGQKCWQSYAQDMDYLWVLARTGKQEDRGRGLSLFICDKKSAGVKVNPLPTLDGDQLNEVFFDNVHIPIEQRVGAENSAWAIIGKALADERHIQFPPGRVRRDLEEMVEWLNKNNLGDDPVVRHRMAELAAQVMETEILGLKVLEAMAKGKDASIDAAMNKVIHTLTCQDIVRAVLDFGGPEALVTGSRPELIWRQSLTETIGGGTTEIMRSVVSRQALGLKS